MVGFIVARPEAGEIVQFVLRELAHPTSALDTIYNGVFAPTHARLCQVWADATGEDAESDRTKITVFTMIGQVIYFRIGREAVMRRMGWNEYRPEGGGGGDRRRQGQSRGDARRPQRRQAMSFVCSIPLDRLAVCELCAGRRRSRSAMSKANMCCWRRSRWPSVETVSVRRGDRVKAGDAIAMLETSDATIAVAQAEAALAQAEAQLADLQIGRRPEEIAVLEATLVSAQAQKEEAERVLSRLADLLKRGISTQADYDQAKTALDVATAMVGQARGQSRRRQTAGARRRRSRPPRTR